MLSLDNNSFSNLRLPIPKELHRLANFLLLHAKTKPDLFLTSGNLSLSPHLRSKLDLNLDLNPSTDDPYTLAFVLLDLLHTLLTPILPTHLLDPLLTLYESESDSNPHIVMRLLLQVLPRDNARVFVYMIAFFREMLACGERNKLTVEKVAEIMVECMVGEQTVQGTAGRREGIKKSNLRGR